MAPLIVMLVGWALFRLLGTTGVLATADSLPGALRFALAVMFVFTAASHFVPRTRADLVRMVPPALPNAAILVTATGIFELFGAIGLLVPATARWSAMALIALLVAMLPANISAARRHLTIAGRPATPLAIRLPLQLFWIGALWWVAR
jgi:uncharacterized membrane protein